MKNSKKLTILGLSAATALVGATGAVSSFAWFATNGSVSATGLAIKSKVTNNYLEIKRGSDEDTNANWLTTVTAASTETKQVAPVHPVKEFSTEGNTIKDYDGGNTLSWVTATSADANKYDRNGVYSAATVGKDGGDYALVETFNIRIRPGTEVLTATNLELSAVAWSASSKITGDAAKIAPALRVLAYNATEGGTNSGTIWSYSTGSWSRVTTTTQYLSASFTSEQPQTINVYVYIDGEDTACTSNNARVGLSEGYSVDLTFSIAK